MIRLNSPEIHYLDFDLLQEYSNVNIKTKEGDVIKLNPLTLATFNSDLSRSILALKQNSEEDIVIVTEYSWLDLISVQHFCMKGLFPLPPEELINENHQNVSKVFQSFGIDLKSLAQENLVSKREIKEEPMIHTRSQKRKKEQALIVPKIKKREPQDSDDDWLPDMECDIDFQVAGEPKEEIESEESEVDDEDKDATWNEPIEEPDVKPKRRDEPVRKARRDNVKNFLRYKEELNSVVRLPVPEQNDVDKSKLESYVLQEPPESYIKPPEPIRTMEIDETHKPIQCTCCTRRFNNEKGLKIHLLRFHTSHYSCPYCRYDFPLDDFEAFRKHMFRHEHVTKVTEPAECIQCGYSSIRMESIRKHVKSSGPYHTNQCTQCTATFTSWAEHKTHVANYHANIWKLKCGQCEEMFDTKQKVQSHKQKVHYKLPEHFPVNKGTGIPKDQKQKFCELCGKIVQSLTYHIKNYHMDQNLTCQHCGKTYKSQLSLSHHIGNVHEKVACSICGEMVSKKREWRHIQQKHTANENKKYKCKYCNKGFISSANLRDHIHTHTGEKPYICKFCGAAFASVGNHRMHERGHLGHKRSK